MKRTMWLGMVAGLFLMIGAGAQAPSGAPAGATGICKDGTYTTSATKSGACGGHKGVQTWYATSAAKVAPTTAAQAPAPAANGTGNSLNGKGPGANGAGNPASNKGPAANAAAKPQAAGGGPGMVWVNTDSNVYHCYGTTYYGKTKAGSYMSEADAKAKGARPANKKTCGK